ncbi:mitochondrial enolase superfamily member 1 [Grus japonensis]|uniref:Mitochondrial enolase superfamily member 1 n=1 Tax=Grus japonensis TaxID=30415 RepID=A0ABC9VU34_GRUJA
MKNKGDIVVGVYRSQDVNTEELFYRQLGEMSASVAFVLMGDFGFPNISWEYPTAVANREQTRKAKAQLELKLASVVSDNKKGFFKYVNSKRRSKENIGPILVEDGHPTNKDEEKAEPFNVVFASVFNNTDRPWAAQSPESEDHDFPFVDTEIVRNQLYQLNVHKSMGPDGIHPRVLKKIVDVMAGPLSIIYERSNFLFDGFKLQLPLAEFNGGLRCW